MEIGILNPRRPRVAGSPILLTLSRAQAKALARLIHIQLDAYAEAVGGTLRRQPQPVTVADLDRVEPLLAWLE